MRFFGYRVQHRICMILFIHYFVVVEVSVLILSDIYIFVFSTAGKRTGRTVRTPVV